MISWGSSKLKVISQLSPSRRSPLHDHREDRQLSRVFAATHPIGVQPAPDVLLSKEFASTKTVVLVPASTSPDAGEGEGEGSGRQRDLHSEIVTCWRRSVMTKYASGTFTCFSR